jgi:hypothetical protein
MKHSPSRLLYESEDERGNDASKFFYQIGLTRRKEYLHLFSGGSRLEAAGGINPRWAN